MSERELNIKVSMDSKQAVKGSKETAKAVKEVSGETKKAAGSANVLSGGLRNASQGMAAIEGPLGGISGRLSTFASITARAETAIQAKTKSMGAMRLAMLAIPIFALIAALGTLFQAFRSTQEGADRINRILIPVKSVFEALWGVIQSLSIAMADGLVKAIQNPGEAFRALGELLVNQVQNRITGVIEGVGALGRALARLVRGDFKGAMDAGRDYVDSMLQVATGTENAAERIRNFGRDIRDASREAFEAGRQIQSLNEAIEQLRIDQEVPLARLNREYRELINVARDSTIAEEERLVAIDKALATRRRITAEEMKLLDLEIQRMELQQSLNDTSREEELELQKLIARREELIARTEQELGRRLSMRNSILNAIEEQAEAERQAEAQRIAAMEKEAEVFLEMLLSEEELRQKSLEKQIAQLEHLLEEEIITREQFLAVREQLEDDFLNRREEQEELHVGSLMYLEQQLAEARLAFRMAANEEERAIHAEEMDRIQERVDAILSGEDKATASRLEGYQRASEGAIRYGQDARDTAKSVIDSIFAEAVARLIKQIISSVPFPFNLGVAAGAGAMVTGLRSQIPEFLQGGLTSPGRKIISVNEDGRPEYIVNARSTRRALPLLEQINRSPAFAENLMRSLELNQFLDGGVVSRPAGGATAADVPFRAGTAGIEQAVAKAIREGMRGVRVDAHISAARASEELSDYNDFETSIGN